MKNVRNVINETYYGMINLDPDMSITTSLRDLEQLLRDVQNDAIDETARMMSNLFGGCTKETKDIVVSGIKVNVK